MNSNSGKRVTIELPHDRTVEESLIGAVMINPQAMTYQRVSQVRPQDFYIRRYGDVWEAILSLKGEHDIVTLASHIQWEGVATHEKTGFLSRLLNVVPSALNADEYADIVIDLSRRREDILIAQQLSQQAFAGEVDRASIVERLTSNQRQVGGAVSLSTALSDLVTEVEERAKNPREVWGISTGFIDLDKRMGGLQAEQTMMLAAPPGVGKSILAMQIAKYVADHNHSVVIYSFEMSAKRVLRRMISAEAGIPTRAMNTGYMDGYWDEFYQSVETMDRLPMHFADIYGMTTTEVRSDISRLRSRIGSIDLIVVDYLNKLLDRDGGDDLSNTKLKAQRMQSICREFQIAGILIQSMNKDGMRASVPVMADMSGPADTAHEGDNVFLMGNHPKEEGVIQLYPAKMRDGDMGRGPIALRWATRLPKFVNYASPKQAEAFSDYLHK